VNNLTNIDNTDTATQKQQEQRSQSNLRQLLAILTTNLSTTHDSVRGLEFVAIAFKIQTLNHKKNKNKDPIIFWNAESVQMKKHELQESMQRERIDICTVKEAQLSPNVPFNICYFATYRQEQLYTSGNSYSY
jgi:hypothetical protein